MGFAFVGRQFICRMKLSGTIARHYRGFLSGGNATGVNLRDTLAGVTVERANARVGEHNTIAVLLFHMQYYTGGIMEVLRGGELRIRDRYSFEAPAIVDEREWRAYVAQVLAQAESFATLIERWPEERWGETFVKTEYGTYYDNVTGNLEHQHYHLGQVVMLVKLLG